MDKNFCVVLNCAAGSWIHHEDREWTVEYGPYTGEEATKIVTELESSYSLPQRVAVRGFSVLELKPLTVAEINVEVDRINAECGDYYP